METPKDTVKTTADCPAATFSAAIKSLRERSRVLLRQQADRVRELEGRLEQQFTAAVERLEQEPREIGSDEQQLFDRVASLERDLRHLQQLRRESEQALDEARTMLGEMEEERRILRERLDQAESLQGAPTSAAAAATPPAIEEAERLNRRLEMAMQEIRELKLQNEELAEQSKRGPATSKFVEMSSNRFDWESQKQRLLEELSSGFDTQDPVRAKEKIRCEEVIRITDRVVAEKDREIAELRKQLEELPDKHLDDEQAQAGAEAILAADEVIAAERARLAEFQAQWQEKLRQAEVEISIERAKIARERTQLDEKLRLLAAQNTGESPATSGDAKATKGGRWLSRLGLSGETENR